MLEEDGNASVIANILEYCIRHRRKRKSAAKNVEKQKEIIYPEFYNYFQLAGDQNLNSKTRGLTYHYYVPILNWQ